MNINKFFKKSSFIYYVFFLLIAALVYWKLIHHFFEQDEWMGMGHIFAYGLDTVTEGGSLPEVLLLGVGRPAATFVNYVFYKLFAFNTFPLGIFSIFLHGSTMYFLFVLLKKLGSKTEMSVLATLFLGINATSNQAVTWFSSLPVVLSSLFLLLSMIAFLEFVKSRNRKALFFSYVLFYLSFLTKEINVLFGAFFFSYHYFYGGRDIRKTLKVSFLFLIIAILAFSRYFFSYFLNNDRAGLIINNSGPGLGAILKNAILVPVASLGQVFVSPDDLYSYGRKIFVLFQGTDPGDLFVQTTMGIYFSVAISILFVVILIAFYRRGMVQRKNLAIGFLIYLLGILPYVVIEGSGFAYLEGRYYYLALIGVAVIFAGLKGFEKLVTYKILLGVLFLLYFVMQFGAMRTMLDRKIEMSKRRSALVQELGRINLRNSKRNIFFGKSEEEYLGQKLPFQQGVGYTLMVIFYPQGVIPKNFLAENHLWDVGTQGYFEDKETGLGFGYFYDPVALKRATGNLEPESFNLIILNYRADGLDIELN